MEGRKESPTKETEGYGKEKGKEKEKQCNSTISRGGTL
jgi:hypothetical protein